MIFKIYGTLLYSGGFNLWFHPRRIRKMQMHLARPGARTCAILVYEQRAVDTLISVDGEEELIVYLASVGKV